MLDIRFLGYGGAWFPEAGNTSACIKLEEDGKKYLYLFDCGETVFLKLMKNKILEDIDEINLLITHFHSDHIGSLGSLITYSYFSKNIPISIYTPHRKELEELLKHQGVEKDFYNTVDDIKDFNNSKIEFIDVIKVFHAEQVDAYSYAFKDNEDGLYVYTGDIKIINKELMKYINMPNTKRVFIDTNVKGDSPVHLNLVDLINTIKPKLFNKIYCMHFNSDDDIEEVKKYGLKSASDLLY